MHVRTCADSANRTVNIKRSGHVKRDINGSCKHCSVHSLGLLASSNRFYGSSDVVKSAEIAATQALCGELELAQLRSELPDHTHIIVNESLRKHKCQGYW